jgi:serralysin
MAENSSSSPASAGNNSIAGTVAADSVTGGGGSDTILGGNGADRLSGDAPLQGQWQYSVYTRDFSSANNQTQFITSGTLVGHGYVDDFAVRSLRNTLAGSASGNDQNDYGIIYRSTITITTSGTYTFSTTSDDGSRIIIRDASGATVLNLDNDFHQAPTTRTASVTLTAGQTYSIEVLYWENVGGDVLSATISGPGFGATDLATSSLLQTPPSAPGHVDGNDSLLGEAGDDTLTGGGGNDRLYGGDNSDSIFGETGQDQIYGGSGVDRLYGGADADTIYGGLDNDLIDGGTGADSLYGDAGNDTIYGDTGNDLLEGGFGADLLYGGNDRDRFTFLDGDFTVGDQVFGGTTGDDFDTLDLSGYGWARTDITYTTPDRQNGSVSFFDAQGLLLGEMQFTDIEEIVPCFTAGTLIETPDGPRPVESIRPGDLVNTLDEGPQRVRWVGLRALGVAELITDPQFQPVLFEKGSLGIDLPDRPLTVSPQHRMLVTGAKCELCFGEAEFLAPALHLAGLPGIRRALKPVTYVHLMFDRHQIVRTHGVWSESFQPGTLSLDSLSDPQRDKLVRLFPDLADGVSYPAARSTLRAYETRVLFCS